MKKIIILLCFLATSIAQGEGFLAGTLIKTPGGYTAIEELKEGDRVICLNAHAQCVEAPIEKVFRKKANKWCVITLKNGDIFVQTDHKFYDAYMRKWVLAKDLEQSSLLLHGCTDTHRVFDTREVKENGVAYTLTVAKYHNFFVSEHEIVVHNVIPLIAWGGGQGLAFVGWNAVGAGILSTAAGIGATWLVNGMMKNIFGAKGSVNYDEYVLDEILEGIRTQQETMTRKEARRVAKEKGWKEVKDPGFNSHGQPVFKDGRKIITPDVDGHRGGRWKVFWNENPDDRTTYKDDDLTVEVGD